MPLKLPKPTAESVRKLHAKLLDDWRDRFVHEAELRDLVHQRNEIDMLEDDETRNMKPVSIHSGRAGGIIEHANGLLMSHPSFSVEPQSLSSEEKRSADDSEKVMAKVFEQQLLANDFWPAVGRDVLTYGRAFLKALPLPSVWTIQQGYPVRKKSESPDAYMARVRDWKASEGEFPFVIQHVPTMNILPLADSNDQVLCTIEEKKVPAYIIAEEMKHAKTKAKIASGDLEWYTEMMCVEYTDHEYVSYFLIDENVENRTEELSLLTPDGEYEHLRTWQHGLGKCPVVMIAGLITELPDKEGRYKSFIEDAKESLEAYDTLISRLATMVWAYYMPSYKWTIAESTAVYQGRDRPTLKVNLGGVTVQYSDEQLEAIQPPGNLPDANLLATQVDDLIQRHTLEDVLFGRVAGSAPAFQVNLRINVARSKLTPIAQHMAQGITNIMDLFVRGVIALNEDVMIGGEKMTPGMAKKAINRIAAQIEPKSPVDRAQDLGTAKMAKEFGLPDDWIMEHLLDIDDPATVRLEKMIQDLEQLPQVQERLLAEAVRQLDIMVEEEEFADLANLDTSQLPPAAMQALESFKGLGRGPYPQGGAPQTIQGGRGLLSPKEQPMPGSPQIPSQ